MLTYLGVTAVIGLAFLVGFLVGDRRGVRQANVILDGNMRELFKVIGEERAPPVVEGEDGEATRPVLH